MSDYTWVFDDTQTGTPLIGQTTLSAIRAGISAGKGAGFGAISGNWYLGNNIFGGTADGGNAFACVTGKLFFAPFYVTKTTTYTAIGVLARTTNGTVVLGLYNDTGNSAPTGSPITNSNSTSLTMTSSVFASYTFSSPITLTSGVYWTGNSTSSNGQLQAFTQNSDVACVAGGRGLGWGSAAVNTNQKYQAGWSQTFAYSATLPSVGSLTAEIGGSALTQSDVMVFLQAQ